MRRILLLVIVVAFVPFPGRASTAGVSRHVGIEFRGRIHDVRIDASLGSFGVNSGISGSGISTGSAEAGVLWIRRDFRGNPFFESAWGRITAQIDDVSGTIKLKGRLKEFFHHKWLVLDVTVKRSGGPTPFANEYQTTFGFRAGAAAGAEWIGDASGSISSSLGRVRSLRGAAELSDSAFAGAGIP